MCGIAGFIDFKSRISKSELVVMTDVIRHRGPDASGYFFCETDTYAIGLGHRRLSVIDLSAAANQPMQFLGERYSIVFNGEIYNYEEVRKILAGLGHQFATKSDTEVILHAYHEWGQDAVGYFVGMFAFVIYDAQLQRVYACRDRGGEKPFFYYWNEDLFLFGSELKALMSCSLFGKEVDLDSIGAFMQFGYIPGPQSIFRDTCKLLPAHHLCLDLKLRKIDVSQYWNVYDFYNQEKSKISLKDAVIETERILEKAFRYRMVADVPVGVFLSGGYDSSCLVALLQKNQGRKIKTFTIGFEDERLNEAKYAKDIALILGTEHCEYCCTESDALSLIEDLPYYYDEPFADNSAIPTMLVSKLARQSVTVALSADAGDEIFGGYDRYAWMLKYYKRIKLIPSVARRGGAAILESLPFEKWLRFRDDNVLLKKYHKLTAILRDPSPQNFFLGMTVDFNDQERRDLFVDRVKTMFSSHYSQELSSDLFDPLSYAMAKDYQTYLVDDILQKVDRATMSVSLEGRAPFLDQNIIEWVAKLPAQYKIRNGERKYILKEIVHKYLPKRIMDRPKMGFTVPVRHWLHGSLKPLVDRYLDEGYIKRQSIFNYNFILQAKKSYFVVQKENDYKIWHLLMFQMWFDKWMNNSAIS